MRASRCHCWLRFIGNYWKPLKIRTPTIDSPAWAGASRRLPPARTLNPKPYTVIMVLICIWGSRRNLRFGPWPWQGREFQPRRQPTNKTNSVRSFGRSFVCSRRVLQSVQMNENHENQFKSIKINKIHSKSVKTIISATDSPASENEWK